MVADELIHHHTLDRVMEFGAELDYAESMTRLI